MNNAKQVSVGQITLDWWRETISDPEKDRTKGKPRDRGAKAQLRRCGDPTEVFFCPAFHKLLYALHAGGRHHRETAAVIAGVLAHVKENAGGARFAWGPNVQREWACDYYEQALEKDP
jgi:CRISPR system Cascade subunit CasB